ncbi:MAG: DNA mismatch repair protein MutS [Acidobacteria bacterium]|nr:DNA mismatch repair protein MutS [Acidobacteriota bacterium]
MHAEYASRLEERRRTLAALERVHARFSYVRLGLAAAAIATIGVGGWGAAAWLALPIGALLVVAFLHARLLNRRDAARAAIAFYERALDRLAGRWAGRGRSGDRFKPADHLYASDLDLFGRGSLFDLVATVRTDEGEETLARWLLAPAPPDVVRARQAAVRELSPRLDLREAVAVVGQAVRDQVKARLLRAWASSPRRLPGGPIRLLFPVLAAISIATLALWLVRTGGDLRDPLAYVVLAVLAAQGLAAQIFRNRVHDVAHAVDEPSHELDAFASLLEILERERFQTDHLRRLQADIVGDDVASGEIRRLSQYVAMLASRENVLFALPASLVLWTTQWACAVEAWRARRGPALTRWLAAVGELEALLAFATLAAEHPDYAFPEIADGPPRLTAEAIAHPALPERAVANDVSLGDGPVRLLIVSGSNMSGKSTLLRTLGVNVVLAQAGAPVRAARLVLTPLDIGASISIHDSLLDGRSRFFTEIQRLKRIADLAEGRRGHVLFLLDEILGGTNSHDRRVGAEALLAALAASGAVGLATTHDLALAEIAERLAPAAANVHFEDQLLDGTLAFDYRIRPGLVRTSNALRLMRGIGFKV